MELSFVGFFNAPPPICVDAPLGETQHRVALDSSMEIASAAIDKLLSNACDYNGVQHSPTHASPRCATNVARLQT